MVGHIFLVFFMLFPSLLSAQTLAYSSKDKREIFEIFTHKPGGFLYNYTSKSRKTQLDVSTNSNAEITYFLHTDQIKNRSTKYEISGDTLTITSLKQNKTSINTIPLQNLPLILFPEIQLVSFINDDLKQDISYITMRLDNLKIFTADARKLKDPEIDYKTALEVTFQTVPSTILKFIYYFNKNGLGIQRNMYLLDTKTPKIILTIDK